MINASFALITSFVFSFFVAFTALEYFYVLPLIYVLFLQRQWLVSILKKWLVLNLFILFLVLFVYFQNPNEALILLVRTNMILLFNLSLFYHSKGFDIVRGLLALKFPNIFVSVFYFTLVMIQQLFKELKQIKMALTARGFQPKSNGFTYEVFGNMFAMMFIKAIKKANSLNESMLLRGFSGQMYLLSQNKIALSQYALFGLIIFTISMKGIT
jgi:cobalt/nickel transport system permease protein